MAELKDVICNNITELRKRANITQSELAEKLNYSDKAVSKWERGDSLPDITVLKSIADIFNVSLDYLTQEEHREEDLKPIQDDAKRKKNRTIISLLATMLVWLIATVIYVTVDLSATTIDMWKVFIYALPVSFIVLLVFNSIWGRRSWTFVICSLLVWSILLSVYIMFLEYNMWLIFVIGVPAQIIILLWARLYTK